MLTINIQTDVLRQNDLCLRVSNSGKADFIKLKLHSLLIRVGVCQLCLIPQRTILNRAIELWTYISLQVQWRAYKLMGKKLNENANFTD